LFVRQKDAGTQSLAKKNAVQFHQQNLSQICELKFSNFVHHLLNSIFKKASHLVLQKKLGKNVGEIYPKRRREYRRKE